MQPSPITIRFTRHGDDWRLLCHPGSGRCFIWRNGSFVRSTTYVAERGLPAMPEHRAPRSA